MVDFGGFRYRDAEYNLYILIDCSVHVTAQRRLKGKGAKEMSVRGQLLI